MADAIELAAHNETDTDKRLAAMAKAYLQFALDRPDAYRVMYEVNQKDELRYPELVKQIKRTQLPMVYAVEEAVAAGSIQGDPVNIVHVFWAGIPGLVSLYLSGKLHSGREIEEMTEVMVRSLARAVASKPSAKPAARRIRE